MQIQKDRQSCILHGVKPERREIVTVNDLGPFIVPQDYRSGKLDIIVDVEGMLRSYLTDRIPCQLEDDLLIVRPDLSLRNVDALEETTAVTWLRKQAAGQLNFDFVRLELKLKLEVQV